MDQMPPQSRKLPKELTLVQSLYIMETQLRPSGPLGFAKFFGDCFSSRIPLPGLKEPGEAQRMVVVHQTREKWWAYADYEVICD